MARDIGPFSPDETTPRPATLRGEARGTATGELDERLLDLENEEESPFLRAQRRIPVRRGPLPRKAANRLKVITIALVATGALAGFAAMLIHYGAHSWRFRIDSSDNIEIVGTENVSHAQVMEVLGGDIGRDIFYVPLDERKKQLEQIPWVESATVMRLLPNRLRVDITERTPIAFARVGAKILLVDANGVLMDLPLGSRAKYSFPVITGFGGAEPLSTRSARMNIYTRLVHDLDSGGANYSQDLSEVDLNDPEDVKCLVADPSGAVLVHLGSAHFLDRYKLYIAHIQEWRQQYGKVDSVDLRYDRQVIVNPDSKLTAPPAMANGAPENRNAAHRRAARTARTKLQP